MRPVRAQLCKFESALDGTLRLYHFGLLNDALDVSDENARRIDRYNEDRKGLIR